MWPHLREIYGEDNTAGVAAYTYFWGKAAIKAAARVLFDCSNDKKSPPAVRDEGKRTSVSLANALCDLIDNKPKLDLNNELDGSNPALTALIQTDKRYQQIIDLALILQGRLSGESQHASAYILSPHKLTDHIPLMINKDERALVQKGEMNRAPKFTIQVEGRALQDQLGHVKLDLLAINDLEVIDRALETVQRIYGCKIDIENIPFDDRAAFDLVAEGHTSGIFQFDGSSVPNRLIRDSRADKIGDWSAINALNRPGPLQMGYDQQFVEGKLHPESIKTFTPAAEPYLRDTYGVCIAEGQLVDTARGRIPIENVKQGDKVLTEDGQYHLVAHTTCNGVKDVVKVRFDFGEELICTPDHQILTDKGWKQAQELLVAQDVVKSFDVSEDTLTDDNTAPRMLWSKVLAVVPYGHATVYDLSIQDVHSMCVSRHIVHNCVYQENLMLLSQDKEIVGFTGGQADTMRKILAHKDKAKIQGIVDLAHEVAESNGVPREVVDEFCEIAIAAGSYSFNKSHALAYALIAYRGAFIKAHFPEAFLSSMCTLKPQMKGKEKVPDYLEDARQLGVTIKPPHVNYSMENFDVPEKGVIAFGLGGIKRVGQGAAPIIAEREANGPFKDFTDFCTRVPKQVGKAPIEALIKAGALDGLGWSRMAMEESIEQIIDFRKSYFAEKEKKELFSDDLFGDFGDDGDSDEPAIQLIAPFDTEYSELELMHKEKEQFGMYFGRDPRDFSQVSRYMLETRLAAEATAARKAGDYEHPVFININQVPKLEDNTKVEFIANVSDVRAFTTKKGSRMAFVTVWDNGIGEESRFGFAPTKSTLKCTVFARTWENMFPPLPDDVVRVSGRINVDKEGRFPTSVIVDEMEAISPDSDWIGASAPLEKTMEYAQAREEMEKRDAELADPSSARYMIPALEFKDTTDLDAFLLDPDLAAYNGNGKVQVSVRGDESGSRTEILPLKQTRGMVAFATRYGAVAKKIRLPKAQRAMERKAMMGGD